MLGNKMFVMMRIRNEDVIQMKPFLCIRGCSSNDGQYREQYHTITNHAMPILFCIYFYMYSCNIRCRSTCLCHCDWGTKFDILIQVIITYSLFILDEIQEYHQYTSSLINKELWSSASNGHLQGHPVPKRKLYNYVKCLREFRLICLLRWKAVTSLKSADVSDEHASIYWVKE